MKFSQILVRLMISISNLFLPLLKKIETSSIPFYDFDKMAV